MNINKLKETHGKQQNLLRKTQMIRDSKTSNSEINQKKKKLTIKEDTLTSLLMMLLKLNLKTSKTLYQHIMELSI